MSVAHYVAIAFYVIAMAGFGIAIVHPRWLSKEAREGIGLLAFAHMFAAFIALMVGAK